MTGSLEALLTVQELDTIADQLRHRRAHLPERVALGELARRCDALEAELATVRGEAAELNAQQRRREDEIATLSAKIIEVDKTLYSGSVRAVRELQAMQEEIESLQRRRGHLEDQVFELMEQLEPIDAAAADLEEKLTALADEIVRNETSLAEGERTIDAELAGVLERRAGVAEPVAAPLLAEYESLRARLGVGVARLTGNRCEGCHLTLPAVEIDRIRHEPPDALVHCSECGRLLVR